MSIPEKNIINNNITFWSELVETTKKKKESAKRIVQVNRPGTNFFFFFIDNESIT